jgi:hypothetical protein
MIYYFASQDDNEKPWPDEWDIWNYFIPLSKNSYGGIFISFTDDIYDVQDISDFQEKLVEVSYPIPERMMQAFIDGIFRAIK